MTLLRCFAFAILLSPPAVAQGLGAFDGEVVAKWLDDGRKMMLVEPFAYVDPSGVRWIAPKGSIIDGASIPRFAWSIIGGPFEGPYRNASVIHDVACDLKARPWQDVHKAFYMAMLAGKVDVIKAKTMYAAVYQFGPRWERQVNVGNIPLGSVDGTVQGLRSSASPGDEIDTMVSPIPRRGCPEGRLCMGPEDLPPEAANVTVIFRPAPPTLGTEDFEKLKSFIEATNPSLAAIENYRP